MLVKSAESHEGYGSVASAALAHIKAAQIALQNQKNPSIAADHYETAANLWGLHGSLDKSAETLSKAAKEVFFIIYIYIYIYRSIYIKF